MAAHRLFHEERLDNFSLSSLEKLDLGQFLVGHVNVEMILWIFLLSFPSLTQAGFDGIYVDYYNSSHNPVANDFFFKLDVGKIKNSNFTFEIEVLNKVHVLTQTSELS
jgi:hypothetical protein